MNGYVPKEMTLKLDPNRRRLTGEQVAKVLRCICRDDQPKQIPVTWRGPFVEMHNGTYFREVTASGYNMTFLFLADMTLGNCVAMVTPAGAEFNCDTDKGLPSSYLSVEDKDLLQSVILFDPDADTVSVQSGYRIVINAGKNNERSLIHWFDKSPGATGKWFPSELRRENFFTDKDHAERLANEFREYMLDVQRKKSKTNKKK